MVYSIRTTISWADLFIDIQINQPPALYTREPHCQQTSLECCMITLVVDPQNYGSGKVAKNKNSKQLKHK